MNARGSTLTVLAAATSLLWMGAGCATRQDTQAEIHKLENSVQRAIGAGALKRAPEDLGQASASLKAAQHEFDEWDNDVDKYVTDARASVKEVWTKLQAHRPEIMLQSVYFRNGSAEIRDEDTPILDEAIKTLMWEDDTCVVIEGNTSSPASARFNYHLSERRAEAVGQYLMDHGIAQERIGYAPHSEFEPVASNRTRAGRAENRNVQFKVLRTWPLGYADTEDKYGEPKHYDFPAGTSLDANKDDTYMKKTGKKFARGMINLATGFIELPKTFSQTVAKRDLLTGTGYGTVNGSTKAVGRTSAGVYELGTFFVPLPSDYSTVDPDVLDLRHIF
jgi:putative exosortase-associated protein (TIGR04073 family)